MRCNNSLLHRSSLQTCTYRTGEFTHDMLIAQPVSTTIVTRVAAFVSRAFNIIRDKLRALTWFPGRHVLPEARAGTLVLLNSTVCHKGASILRKKTCNYVRLCIYNVRPSSAVVVSWLSLRIMVLLQLIEWVVETGWFSLYRGSKQFEYNHGMNPISLCITISELNQH